MQFFVFFFQASDRPERAALRLVPPLTNLSQLASHRSGNASARLRSATPTNGKGSEGEKRVENLGFCFAGFLLLADFEAGCLLIFWMCLDD